MKVRVITAARNDLLAGFRFYERQCAGLGARFLAAMDADLRALAVSGGIHQIVFDHWYRSLSKRFPFAIYYRIEGSAVCVYAILDCRRHPSRAARSLHTRSTVAPTKQ